MVKCTLARELTDAESEAVRAYASEAVFFHAIYQGWQDELAGLARFQQFRETAKAHRDGIDSAIGKATLDSESRLYSGHGRGFAARGCLCGDPAKFVGLRYRYRGYTSTSSSEKVAIQSFLVKRACSGSAPTLLEFRLPKAFNVLQVPCSSGEFEFLIGREREFVVIKASELPVREVPDPVLHLVLEPAPVDGVRDE
jgi:hypothetical protein